MIASSATDIAAVREDHAEEVDGRRGRSSSAVSATWWS
jgi:hypothetical protein